MDWAELRPRLHRHPELAGAIPYRTSYYKRNWGFCVTHAQYAEMERHDGPFKVVIDSELNPGALTYGEYLVPGRSTEEYLLSCYLCHPSMANDSLSGVLLTAFLARYIAGLKNRHWSYRIVFVPETIGAIAYCACNEAAMKAIDIGLVITTVGGPGKFGYKQSFDPLHPINAMIEDVLAETGTEFITYPFDIHGSDERQYSSQGFRINAATICRNRYYEYAYYHSSFDDLSFVTAKQIAETLEIYVRLIDRLEGAPNLSQQDSPLRSDALAPRPVSRHRRSATPGTRRQVRTGPDPVAAVPVRRQARPRPSSRTTGDFASRADADSRSPSGESCGSWNVFEADLG